MQHFGSCHAAFITPHLRVTVNTAPRPNCTGLQPGFRQVRAGLRHAHATRMPGLQPGLQLARIMECGLHATEKQFPTNSPVPLCGNNMAVTALATAWICQRIWSSGAFDHILCAFGQFIMCAAFGQIRITWSNAQPILPIALRI